MGGDGLQADIDDAKQWKSAEDSSISALKGDYSTYINSVKDYVNTMYSYGFITKDQQTSYLHTLNNINPNNMDRNGLRDASTVTSIKDSLDSLLNSAPANYKSYIGNLLIPYSDNGVTYYRLDQKNPLFTNMQYEMKLIRAYLTTFSIIYEAKRDLRGLVDQELTGDEGFKGMDIPKLLINKVQKAQEGMNSAVQNVLQLCDLLNGLDYQNDVNSINSKYDQQSVEDDNNDPGTFDIFNSEWWSGTDEEKVKTEIARNTDLENATSAYEGASSSSTQFCQSMLETFGASTGDLSVLDATLKTDSLVIYTPSTEDDPQYKQIDGGASDALRNSLVGAGNFMMIAAEAEETFANMRNLANEEMTGIGGRQMRADITGMLAKIENDAVLAYYDETVDHLNTQVQLQNEVREYELNGDKLDKLLKEIQSTSWLNIIGGIFKLIATIAGVIGCFFSPFLIVAAIAGALSGLCTGLYNLLLTQEKIDLENEYKDVLKPQPTTYTHKNNTDNSGPTWYNIANNAENKINTTLSGMTGDNYIVSNNDGYSGGNYGAESGWENTSSFDYVKFAEASDQIAGYEMLELVIEGIREATVTTRNLVHQEMTGIGGRSPSDMTTYTMEAARGQIAFLANTQYKSLLLQTEAENQQAAKDKYVSQLENSLFATAIGMTSALIGPIVSRFTTLYTNQDYDQAEANASFTTSGQLEDATLEALVNSGLTVTDTANNKSKVVVDYDALFKARLTLGNIYIVNDVKASIAAAKAGMRSLVHQEMTGIESLQAGNFVEEVNAANYEEALNDLKLVTKYLERKAEITNKAYEAASDLKNIQDQITAAWWSLAIDGIIAIAVGIISGDYQFAFDLFGLLDTIANAALSRMNYNYMKDKTDGMNTNDAKAVIARLRSAMEASVNSTQNREAALEQEIMDEVTDELIEDLGGGKWGVNSSLSSIYQDLLKKAFRAESVMAKLRTMKEALRNIVTQELSKIRGVSTDAETQVISKQMEGAMASIDTLFQSYEQLCAVHNEITAAQIATAKAEAKMIMDVGNAIIKTLTFAAGKLAKGNVDSKANDVDTAKITLKNAFDSGVKATIGNAQKALDAANKALDAAQVLAKVVSLISTLAQILVTIILTEVAKEIIKQGYEKAEASSSQGVSKTGQNTSQLALKARQASGGMDMESMIAQVQADTGQSQLDYEKVEAQVQKSSDMHMYKQDSMETFKEIAESVFEYQKGMDDLRKEVKGTVITKDEFNSERRA